MGPRISERGTCVRLLGPVQFVDASGAAIDLPSSSQRRLLAVLALSPAATLRSDLLSDLLELSPGALRTSVSRLRARIGAGCLETDGVGYGITCAVDTVQFTSLLRHDPEHPDRLTTIEQALALCRGDVLEEFRHEPWAEAEVARIDELRRNAIEDRAELLIERGRSGEAVAALEAHVARDPLRDRGWALLIEALASGGRQAAALRAFQTYRDLLADEFGTEPSAHVRSIEQRVAAGWHDSHGEPRAGSRAAAVGTSASVPIDVPLPGPLSRGVDLAGRARPANALTAELALARTGQLRSVLVTGEAGIGKTALLAAFAQAQRRQHSNTIVYGRCDEGAQVPLQPFLSIVGTLVEHAPLPVLRAHCERWGGELQRIAPHLAGRLWVPAPYEGDGATQQHLLFDAIADLIRRLSEVLPLVLLLDDLHWAEPTALLLLRHLCRALVDAPVLVVVSYRDIGELLSPELRSAVTDLEDGRVRRIVLEGLDDRGITELVRSIVDAGFDPGPDLVTPLLVETAGNPLYATQLVLHLCEAGVVQVDERHIRLSGSLDRIALPRSLVDLVWRRVRELGDAAAEILRAASVLGVEVREDMLIEVVDQSEAEVAAVLDAAISAGLLVEADDAVGSVRFGHALVLHALYSQLHGPTRRRLHQRAARALQKAGNGVSPQAVVQLARHCALAGDLGAAQRWASAAGDRAAANLADIEAASWYATALEHAEAQDRPDWERAALKVRLGEALHRAGDPRARSTLLDAAAFARDLGAHDIQITAVLANDRGFVRVGAADEEWLASIEAALEVVDPEDLSASARLHALCARELIHTTRFERRHELAHQAIAIAGQSDDPALLPQVITGLLFALWAPGALPLRRSLVERAIQAACRLDDPVLEFWARRAGYFVAIESADPTWARESLERLTTIAAQAGQPRLQWICLTVEAFEATMQARFREAEERAGRALEIGLEIGEGDAFTIYAGQLFSLRSFAGRYDELLPVLETAVQADPGVLGFRLARALTAAVLGQPDSARQLLAAGVEDNFASVPLDAFWVTTIIGYSVLAIEVEDALAAALLYPMLEPLADQVAFSGATSQGPISAYLGKLASLQDDHDLADEHLRRALLTTRAFGWRYHEAMTLVAQARLRRRRAGGLDEGALEQLAAAEAIAGECGLEIVAKQAAIVRT